MRRDPLAWVNDRPAQYRRERNHIIRQAILYGLVFATLTHAAFLVRFSPNRRNQ